MRGPSAPSADACERGLQTLVLAASRVVGAAISLVAPPPARLCHFACACSCTPKEQHPARHVRSDNRRLTRYSVQLASHASGVPWRSGFAVAPTCGRAQQCDRMRWPSLASKSAGLSLVSLEAVIFRSSWNDPQKTRAPLAQGRREESMRSRHRWIARRRGSCAGEIQPRVFLWRIRPQAHEARRVHRHHPEVQ